MTANVFFKKTDPNAQIPFRGSAQAAGYDLRAVHDCEIAPGETVKVNTGLAAAFPDGTFGAIFPRSGLATKRGLRPANCVGVVDTDYRGDIIVALHNDSHETQNVEAGERIAQLIIIPYIAANYIEVDNLDETERGASGFGGSGTK